LISLQKITFSTAFSDVKKIDLGSQYLLWGQVYFLSIFAERIISVLGARRQQKRPDPKPVLKTMRKSRDTITKFER